MKRTILAFVVCLLAGMAQATTVNFSFSGQLGSNNQTINRPFANGTFAGTFSIDTDAIDSVTSNRVLYRLTAFNALVTGPGGESRSFVGPNRNDGPLLNEAASFFAVFIQDAGSTDLGFELALFEVYDGSETNDSRDADRRFLRLNFAAQTDVDLVTSFADLAAADPLFGARSRFDGGVLQLAASTVATGVVSAQVSTLTADVPAVPLPATGLLLIGAVGGLAVFGRRRPSKL